MNFIFVTFDLNISVGLLILFWNVLLKEASFNAKDKFMITAIQEISTIIERDSKDTTYKFALLRACIQITQDYGHYEGKKQDEVFFPLGLVVLKWLEYYYPLFENSQFVPQKNGDNPTLSLAFRKDFNLIIQQYSSGLGYYQFNRDLKDGSFEQYQKTLVGSLVKIIRKTIVRMPMHYIGSSVNKGGQIFKYYHDSKFSINESTLLTDQYIIDNCGTFSMPKNYHEAFLLLGSFISGTHTLLTQWANFTIRADKENKFSRGEILELLDPAYEKGRDVTEIRSFYEKIKSNTGLVCVWSGKMITDDLNIDHMMPYSLWKNDDFWNLLPAQKKINGDKLDKIPSPELLYKQKDIIVHYWEMIYIEYPLRLKKELQMSLLGLTPFDESNWQNKCLESFANKCDYLINHRGFEPFNL